MEVSLMDVSGMDTVEDGVMSNNKYAEENIRNVNLCGGPSVVDIIRMFKDKCDYVVEV